VDGTGCRWYIHTLIFFWTPADAFMIHSLFVACLSIARVVMSYHRFALFVCLRDGQQFVRTFGVVLLLVLLIRTMCCFVSLKL
jgi:hypothetical protein